jgi:hypothetical protein
MSTELSIIPRSSWQDPAMPVRQPGQAALQMSRIRMFVAHYTAAQTVPTDTASYLRAIQRDYLVNRGYSIGYNFAVDRTGQAWECRGWDIQAAANRGYNDQTITVLCLVNWQDAMGDPPMAVTFRNIGAEANRRTGRTLTVVGHNDIGATRCPGDGITAQLAAGALTPGTGPAPTPPPPDPQPEPEPIPEDDDMSSFIITNRQSGEVALVYADGLMVGLAGPDLGGYSARFGDPIPTDPVVWSGFLSKQPR